MSDTTPVASVLNTLEVEDLRQMLQACGEKVSPRHTKAQLVTQVAKHPNCRFLQDAVHAKWSPQTQAELILLPKGLIAGTAQANGLTVGEHHDHETLLARLGNTKRGLILGALIGGFARLAMWTDAVNLLMAGDPITSAKMSAKALEGVLKYGALGSLLGRLVDVIVKRPSKASHM